MSFHHKILVVLFSIVALYSPLFSQKTKDVVAEGEYKMPIDENMSLTQAREMAIRRAQIEAIESVFGRSIVQHHISSTSNSQTGHNVETKTDYNFLDESSVNGDWIEDINKPIIEFIPVGDVQWIHVKVKGKVREKTSSTTKFEVGTLTCPERKCQTESFNDGQSLFLYFKSPDKGFLAVYMADPDFKKTLQILPYKSSKTYIKDVPVQADKEYIFFNRSMDCLEEGRTCIDDVVLNVDRDAGNEQCELFVLFSSDPLDKPVLTDFSADFLSKEDMAKGYTLAKGTDNDKFQKWLQDYRAHDKKLQFSSLTFSIKRN